MSRPALFVGSSSEGLRIAETVQILLDEVCEVQLWTQGTFGLTRGTLESLYLTLPRFDFALLALTADDITFSRGVEKASARDNVLFELGLFIGSLGPDRTFMLYDRTDPPVIPTDLAGITAATFAPHVSGNLEAALGAPCAKIRRVVEELGIRANRESRDFEQAFGDEGVGATARRLHEYMWPAPDPGQVWIWVMPSAGTTGQNHEIELRWGGWHRRVCLPIGKRGITLVTSKGADDIAVPCQVEISPAARVNFGMGEVKDREILNIEHGWERD
jgi:hypothetical protein